MAFFELLKTIMGKAYQIDGDDDEVTLWEGSPAFRRLVYGAIALVLLTAYGFWVSAYLQEYQRHIDMINQQYRESSGTNEQLIEDVLPKKSRNPVWNNNPQAASKLNYETLNDYPLATDSWQNRFNPNKIAPSSGFEVYYINQQKPNEVALKEIKPNIAMNYYGDEIKGIPTKELATYWVGRISVPKDGIYFIKKSGDWKSMRILLDGHIMDKGSFQGTSELNVYLKEGNYLLEVEMANKTNDLDLAVNFFHPIITYKNTELSQQLAKLNVNNYNLYFASTYRSDDFNNAVSIHSKVSEPYVLVLSNSEPVNWRIYGNAPQAIIYSGANTSINSVGSPHIVKTDFLNVPYNLLAEKSSCSCHQGVFSCSGVASMRASIEHIEDITGMRLVGGAGDNYARILRLPKDRVSHDIMSRQTQDYEQKRVACQVPTSPVNQTNDISP
ncbi:Uncharacterised protein [Moraxella lacunata]|uniref:PA14 domain-containing protein n=2 Tax=Moraxella lacunata TaxID=477 RepID=A0A378QKR8_MORLA|nr:Uncharacterised protein [Moraxella lacunata]